ncbi:intercompartmental signaling factor BofC [Anaerobacillus arseniciselenatis]|uniref:intercompartmental signaling factor BofC n=1 Tax=Anaerobacillus arseniciselenatis TaxID=85682 RepID=UPI000A644284|nr:intercompartmental signaling factor BofC [Anaerobacillus arseniciselenatis]
MATKILTIVKKHPVFIGLIGLLIIIAGFFTIIDQQQLSSTAAEAPFIRESSKAEIHSAVPVSAITNDPKQVQVVLARVYLDGEISEEIVEETIWSMEDFWAQYREWELIDQNEATVVFQQKVDDISPLLKINGYFGISDEGTLNIYDGNPAGEKVIQSFFQINTKELKSHQQRELQNGIPVLSRDRYEEVLKTYKKYAKQEM